MRKQNEVRYIVTEVVSITVIRLASKTDAYKQAPKPGWGTVEWYSAADGYKNPVARDRSDKTQQLCCDEDCSADLYTKDGGYFGIHPYEEINAAEMPKQAECAAIIISDAGGFSVWAEDFSKVHIFVSYDENGLIDSYRVEYDDTTIYDGEVEISFDDLYERAEDDWRETYRAEIPGTLEYQRKQEAALIDQGTAEVETDSTAKNTAASVDTAAAEDSQQVQPQTLESDAGNGYKTRGGTGPPLRGKADQEQKKKGGREHGPKTPLSRAE